MKIQSIEMIDKLAEWKRRLFQCPDDQRFDEKFPRVNFPLIKRRNSLFEKNLSSRVLFIRIEKKISYRMNCLSDKRSWELKLLLNKFNSFCV